VAQPLLKQGGAGKTDNYKENDMRRKMWLWALVCIIVLLTCYWLQDVPKSEAARPVIGFEGVRIELTKDFYEALRQEGSTGSRTYSNDPRNEYLRRIAVSSEFAVKTNLTIIEQQDRIIKLLEALQNQGQQQK
jgi:hypothetical protein